MKLIVSPFTDPIRNLALEEFLLRHTDDSWLILYRNEPSVLIGRHQNPLEEVNVAYLQRHRIPWLRRISGGGTVYHDPGNINFSFVLPLERGLYNRYEPFLQPLCNFLHRWGLVVQQTSRGDLLLAGKKISGNAQFTTHRRLLSHGTLLYQADLQHLRHSLQPSASVVASRAVSSRRSSVTNIALHLSLPPSVEEFLTALADHFRRAFAATAHSVPDTYDHTEPSLIQHFRSSRWLYERTPAFTFRHRCNGEEYDVTVERGHPAAGIPETCRHDLTLPALAPTALLQ